MLSRTPMRLLLRVGAKRNRDDASDSADTAMLPPLVRVSLDSMGPVPSLVTSAAARTGTSELVFRRLEPISSATAPPLEHCDQQSTNDNTARSLSVSRLVRGHDYILLDCVPSSPHTAAPTSPPAELQLYILDTAAESTARQTQDGTDADALDAFSFDDFTFGSGPADGPLPALAGRARKRNASTAEQSPLAPLYYLTPSRRLECASSTPFNPKKDAIEATRWLFEDAEIQTASALFRAHDVFCANEDLQDVQADLYVYPDHRKDDEYDSNAEDFSGNDYPEDADQGDYDGAGHSDDDDADRTWPSRPTRGKVDDGYGMYIEDDYVEPRLGKGWETDDDEGHCGY